MAGQGNLCGLTTQIRSVESVCGLLLIIAASHHDLILTTVIGHTVTVTDGLKRSITGSGMVGINGQFPIHLMTSQEHHAQHVRRIVLILGNGKGKETVLTVRATTLHINFVNIRRRNRKLGLYILDHIRTEDQIL